ncbi:MAG: DUF4123 domain-containing protein [Novosphingobium sp.]|nr:DUF4123 domain-containing protein [Novosphingobium sp.]
MASKADHWYALIDAAQDPRLYDLVMACKGRICLFKGQLHQKVLRAAPWLVLIDPDEPLLATWNEHGRDANWGLLVRSSLDLEQLQRHFRRFLQAKLPNGAVVLFRFYDPRVFNSYLPVAQPSEIKPWFDGVAQYVAEVAHQNIAQHYSYENGQFQTKTEPV